MQREEVLEQALALLEQRGFAGTTLEILADQLGISPAELQPFWPDREALLYDSLRYHSQQVNIWRQQVFVDEQLRPEQKLLVRYQRLQDAVSQYRFPGCLFIAACSAFPDPLHPIHQIAEQQKQASYQYTKALLEQLETDDTDMVALQLELILEGCLSKLLVKRQLSDVTVAKRLAEDVLRVAMCRKHGALA
ncbi:transcriptional regulator [Dickeya sp. CFBP 2040]|uniref:Transcriptional regulator n=1 Tax=Dickeya poaceiphila TaxID=568768 RepID=A0A5B8IC37_9GAMM|nr:MULTISPECIES: transcriptional regulator [Dickeya]NKI72996.1 transcriptional regulator [Dickeya sp. CFBP 2040]QDX32062.1 transcriptional regulator [Dickeya poaceiphila]